MNGSLVKEEVKPLFDGGKKIWIYMRMSSECYLEPVMLYIFETTNKQVKMRHGGSNDIVLKEDASFTLSGKKKKQNTRCCRPMKTSCNN